MKNILKLGLIALLGVTSIAYQTNLSGAIPLKVAKTMGMIDPLTGKVDAGRFCFEWEVPGQKCKTWVVSTFEKPVCREKDAEGKCKKWGVEKVDKRLTFLERVCTAPPGGECTALVVRGNDVAKCTAVAGASCRARVLVKQ